MPSNEGYRFYGADQFILDADHFQRETGTSDVMTYLFNMESDEADAQMRDFLEEYTTTVQTAYDYECRQDYVSEFEGMRSMFLTLGGALFEREVHVELCGNREAMIDGCQGIVEYNEEAIRLNITKGQLKIWGRGLQIACLAEEGMIVRGYIMGLEYCN